MRKDANDKKRVQDAKIRKDAKVEKEGRGFQIDVVETTNGFIQIQIRMPVEEAKSITRAMRDKRTMSTICKAAKSVGLDKVIKGSFYCTMCMGGPFGGSSTLHELEAKDWVGGFFESMEICGAAFSMTEGKCSERFPGSQPIIHY